MLLIDVGNTRIKWAYVEADHWLAEGATGMNEWLSLKQAFASLPEPNKILISNVACAEAAQQVREGCAAWSCPVEFISARAKQCGVQNTYEQPEKLGSDRWATLIAAWHHEHAACLVVSCGTATTIDALSVQGEFLGGLILPGLDMMQRSLTTGTAQLQMNERNRTGRDLQKFPRNTTDAIFGGAIQATTGAILRQYELLGMPNARCLLSGGAADSVQPYLTLPLLRVENLVLRGLQIIGRENCPEQVII
jgi:type III pantothenate kinase